MNLRCRRVKRHFGDFVLYCICNFYFRFIFCYYHYYLLYRIYCKDYVFDTAFLMKKYNFSYLFSSKIREILPTFDFGHSICVTESGQKHMQSLLGSIDHLSPNNCHSLHWPVAIFKVALQQRQRDLPTTILRLSIKRNIRICTQLHNVVIVICLAVSQKVQYALLVGMLSYHPIAITFAATLKQTHVQRTGNNYAKAFTCYDR